MMELRDWLAGLAAASLVGATPALAQAPRSLFEALPAAGTAAPFSSGFQPVSPPTGSRPTDAVAKPAAILAPATAKPARAADARAAVTVLPPQRPAALASLVEPVAAGRAGGDAAAPAESAPLATARLRRLASADPVRTLPPEAAVAAPAIASPLAVPAEPPAPESAASGPQKPMTRAERRRAREEAKRQAAAAATAPVPASTPPVVATNPFLTLFGATPAQTRGESLPALASRPQIDAFVSHHAKLNGVPEALVHRIIVRESRYNPRAVGRGGAMGLMQIKTATARGVGYTGGPAGLLDAETNLTYGIKYLAGAWRVSGGSHDRAVSHYASGYYYAAKRRGGRGAAQPETAVATPQPPSLFSLFSQQAAAQ